MIKCKVELYPVLLGFFLLLVLMSMSLANLSGEIADGLDGDPVTANANGLLVIAV